MRVITVDPEYPDPEQLQPAAEALRAGRLVAFPTETVYGLGALAFDARAVARIFEAKGRPGDDPLIVHVRPGWDLAGVFEDVTPAIERLVSRHWPGPLTIVAPKSEAVPDIVTSGRSTVAVRAPSHPVAALLLDLVGEPIAAPSANRFSYVSPTSAAHVEADLGDAVDVIVDGGSTPVGIESTIVSVSGDNLTVLRRGAVEVDTVGMDTSSPADLAPGRLDTHYAPRAPTRLLEPRQPVPAGDAVGVVLGYDDSPPPPVGWRLVSLGARHDLEGVAHRLYAALRDIDATRPPLIAVELTGGRGMGEAIDDRLRRAAGGQRLY
jgi:L-threonylcarbamoyladenylate synthase